MRTGISEKGFHSWDVGYKGEKLAKRILHRMGFTVVKSEGTIDDHPFTVLGPKWHRILHAHGKSEHPISGPFSFDLYAEKGESKWFIEVKTTEQRREHSIHLTNRQCRYGFALQTLGYNIGVLRIRLREKEGKKIIQAKLHKIPSVFFRNLFSKDYPDYYPKRDAHFEEDHLGNHGKIRGFREG